MSSEELQNSILAARDRRQELLQGYLGAGCPATIVLSLNIPGPDKNLPGVQGLFSWAVHSLNRALPILLKHLQLVDVLGPHGIVLLDMDPFEVKRRCIYVETTQSCGRLLDLDVYDVSGKQVDRASLGIPPRPCLVCDQPAMECSRLERHAVHEVIKKTDEYLTYFRA